MPIRHFRMGVLEIVLIAVIILMVLGASKVGQIGKNIGKRFDDSEEETEELPVKRTRRKKKVETSKGAPHPKMQTLAIVVLIAGAAFVGVGLSVIRSVSTIVIAGIVIIAMGATLLVLSRRR